MAMPRARIFSFGLLTLLASGLLFSATSHWTHAPWSRLSPGPIISPQGDGWEAAGTFNPAVVLHRGKFVMLYRAQDRDGTSRLGYAESSDGIHFSRLPQPVLSPETAYEKDGGVEDPRLVKFGDTYYLTYTGYNKKDAQLCLATSKYLLHWQRQGVILPAYKGHWNVGWTKSGAIVPEKVNGRYWMYFLGTSADKTDQMGLAYSTDLIHWTEATAVPVLPSRPGQFDSRVVEPGPSPIVTKDGIVMVYLRKEKLLIEADVFTPGPVGAEPPKVPAPSALNLEANVRRLNIDVDRIVSIHQRVVPYSDLLAAIGKKPAPPAN
jgi:predicted GH43/DUF377 family glycosyl hydrolase